MQEESEVTCSRVVGSGHGGGSGLRTYLLQSLLLPPNLDSKHTMAPARASNTVHARCILHQAQVTYRKRAHH